MLDELSQIHLMLWIGPLALFVISIIVLLLLVLYRRHGYRTYFIIAVGVSVFPSVAVGVLYMLGWYFSSELNKLFVDTIVRWAVLISCITAILVILFEIVFVIEDMCGNQEHG